MRLVPILLLLLICYGSEVFGQQPSPDDQLHHDWDLLLHEYVADGRVDYLGLAGSEALLDGYLQLLGDTSWIELPRESRLAYLINGYNSCTVNLILRNRTSRGDFVKSIKDIGTFFSGPWSRKICLLGGKKYSLDQVEHELIRKEFADSRVHFALNCASTGCPPLRAEAYVPSRLQGQLDDAARSFINRTTHVDGKRVKVSKIFDWYRDDFPGGVTEFIGFYAEGSLKEKLVAQPGPKKVEFFPYDWSLNISGK